MKRALKWTLGLFTENFGWKVLSLIIAVAIWGLVATEPELATFASVRPEYKNLPDDLEISSETAASITLELRGPSSELGGAGETIRPAVILDMADVQPGERTFMIGPGAVKLARGVRLVRAIPSEVRLTFERPAVRSLPVSPRFSGEGQNGYVIAHATVDPDKLQVVGPASHVARASVDTDRVDVSSVVGTSEFHVNVFVNDPYVRFRSSPQVAVTVTMRRK